MTVDALPLSLRMPLLSLIILAVAYLAGRIGGRLVRTRMGALARLTATDWDDAAVSAIARRVPFWSVLAGLSVAAGLWSLPGHLNAVINRGLFVLAVGSVTMLVAEIAGRLIRAYSRSIDPALPGGSLIESLIRIAVVGVGVLIVLNGLGVSITPILGALGVGGLAVALALQDTLANLFAGFYMTLAKQIRIGDYIRLAGGEEGYVADVDWRATSLRMLPNNTVLVPNARLSQSIVINYHLPDPELAVLVAVSVDYASDLEQVERVTIDVARDVMTTVPGAVASFEPFIRYHTFADSSINFTVIMRGGEFVDQHLIKHEFVKRLHRRYREAGIVIPFPVRTVMMRAAEAPQPADTQGPGR